MIDLLRQLTELLNPKERRAAGLLVLILIVQAGLEMVAVALIPIYLSALAYPDQLATGSFAWLPLPTEWITQADPTVLIIWASVFLLAFFACKTAYSVAAAYARARFAQKRAAKLSHRLFNAYLNAPYEFHLRSSSSELLRNINNESLQLSTQIAPAIPVPA